MDAILNGPNGGSPLGPGGLTLGRTPDNQVVVNDGKASSQHAVVQPSGQGYTITDLGSTNGTYINGQRIAPNMPRMLMPGDTIRIGDTTYTYQAQNYQQPGMYATPAIASSNYDPTQIASSPQQPFQATAYGGPQNYQPTVPAQPGSYQPTVPAQQGSGSNYQPTMPAFPQYDQQQYNQAYAPQQGYTPPPPPGQAPYDQNNAMTQQASYLQGGNVGAPSSPYNTPSYTPGAGGQSGPGTPPYNPAPVYPPQGGTGYTPPGPPASTRKRSPLMTILLVVVALVVIIGAVSAFAIHNNQVTKDNNDHATVTASAKNNASATAAAQTTAIAQATAAAQATASANPYTSGGTLAFVDDLKNNSGGHGWQEDSNCKFTQNVYEILETHQNTFYPCIAKSTSYGNVVVDVEFTIVQGDCGGIIFRAKASNDAGYYYEVCQDGTYSLISYDGNNGNYLIQPANSSSVKGGIGKINTIGVVASGSNIQLFINGTSVDQVQDTAFTTGSLGLVGDNYKSSGTTVAYAGMRVWTL